LRYWTSRLANDGHDRRSVYAGDHAGLRVKVDDALQVAIAASSELACAELEALLADAADLRVAGTSTLAALAELLGRTATDVLLLEIASPEELERILERVVLPATVLLSRHGHSDDPLRGPGVRATLVHPVSASKLVAAIKAVAAGLIVLDAEHSGTVPQGEAEREPDDVLTPRELEVLQLLASGLPNKSIAATLGISGHTVKFHLSAIFTKLGATSRTEAVAVGIRRGLVMI
jgi:NarL family two-component system response regulator YdfI